VLVATFRVGHAHDFSVPSPKATKKPQSRSSEGNRSTMPSVDLGRTFSQTLKSRLVGGVIFDVLP
jgi:hypothetical protein